MMNKDIPETDVSITVRIESHYGRETIYPVCEIALTFAKIAGTITLTPRVISLIKSLGLGIQVQTPETKSL